MEKNKQEEREKEYVEKEMSKENIKQGKKREKIEAIKINGIDTEKQCFGPKEWKKMQNGKKKNFFSCVMCIHLALISFWLNMPPFSLAL